MRLNRETFEERLISRPAVIDSVPLVLIIIAIALFSWRGTVHKANTADELVHVLAGFSAWTLKDYRINPENGTIPSRVSAFPLLAAGDIAEIDIGDPSWESSQQWEYGRVWWFQSNGNHIQILRLARGAMLLFNLTGLVVLFICSAHLWGRGGGYLSLVIAGFSPTFLGHIPLATSDFAGTWTLFLATVTFAKLMDRPSFKLILASGLTAGTAVLCKHSGLIIAPVAIILLGWKAVDGATLEITSRFKAFSISSIHGKLGTIVFVACGSALLSFALIWAAYGFRYEAASPDSGEFHQFQVAWGNLSVSGVTPLIEFFRNHRLLPESFLYGLQFISSHASRGGFLNGAYSPDGFPAYHVWAWLYKTPLPAMALHLLGLGAFLNRAWRIRLRRLSFMERSVIALGLLYSFVLLSSNLSIGHRHAFPILYLACLVSGICLRESLTRSRLLSGVIIVLALLMIPIAWCNIDRTLSYMNPLGGGHKAGYLRLADSSLDWGQDLPAAVEYIHEYQATHPGKPVYLAYFGSASPEAFGLRDAEYLPSWGSWQRKQFLPDYEPGLYVISASALVTTIARWTMDLEIAYQQMKVEAQPIYQKLHAHGQLATSSAGFDAQPDELELLTQFEHIRFQRLKAALRTRKPDGILQGSILLYHLEEKDLGEFSSNISQTADQGTELGMLWTMIKNTDI